MHWYNHVPPKVFWRSSLRCQPCCIFVKWSNVLLPTMWLSVEIDLGTSFEFHLYCVHLFLFNVTYETCRFCILCAMQVLLFLNNFLWAIIFLCYCNLKYTVRNTAVYFLLCTMQVLFLNNYFPGIIFFVHLQSQIQD